jgi:hypothetical protein
MPVITGEFGRGSISGSVRFVGDLVQSVLLRIKKPGFYSAAWVDSSEVVLPDENLRDGAAADDVG